MKPILALVVPFLVALALGISLILAFGLAPSFSPLYGAIPRTPEAMVRVNTSAGTACGPKDHSTPPATDPGLVGVSPSPTAVTAEWIPSMDSASCRAILTQGGQVIASALATAIDNDPTVAPGSYMCPNDTGTSVTLYFNYGNVRQGEIVDVDLEGCPWIGDPERGGRWWLDNPKVDSSFGPSLATLAPPGWRSYVEAIIHHDFSGSPSKEP
jgi:hypothetical protein